MSLKKVRPVVDIELDRPRKLKYDFNALCEFEAVTGVNLLQPTSAEHPLAKPSLSTLRAFLYAGLKHEDPTLTLFQAGDLLGDVGANYVMAKVSEAYTTALPKAEEGKGATPDPQPAASSTG